MAATVPSAPSVITIVSQSETQITISWTANANNGGTLLTQYNLYWSVNYYTTPIRVVTSNITTVQLTQVDGIVAGYSYSFYMTATNSIGESSASISILNIIAGTLPS